MKVTPKMIAVPGRILQPPRIVYSGKSEVTPVGGSWNMKDKKVLKSATFPNWTILRIGAAANIEKSELEKQSNALTAGFRSCGLQVDQPLLFPGPSIAALNETNEDKTILDKTYVDLKLKEIFERCKANRISMFLVILSSTTPWIHERVKFWGDIVHGMPSSIILRADQVHMYLHQSTGIYSSCVQMNKLRKLDLNYSANVALKVNLKLGGSNQYISPNNLGFLGNGKTMLVGIDVTHPASGTIKGTPSIAGVVANRDTNFSQWPGDIRCQESRKEMVSDLDTMMEGRLDCWVSNNPKQKLENIVVYRDGKYNDQYESILTHTKFSPTGVSEGQYRTVIDFEIPAIRKACAQVFKDAAQPKITFIVVGKHHHTRFYPTKKKEADEKHNCNIKNGTVVDRGITMQKGWDFFLAAHAALQGTVSHGPLFFLKDLLTLRRRSQPTM